MKYLWTEDTGAGLHFWKLVNQLFFDNALVVESKESNQGILYSLTSLNAKEEDEYYIAFDYVPDNQDIRKLMSWTGTGKTDKIKMREDILAAIEDHRIDLSKIKNQTTMQYLSGFKRYSTERVMKSLVGEFTQNEKWSVKGLLMGECWYKDCCVSEHPDSLRCGKPKVEGGSEKMRVLIQSEEIKKILSIITG